MFVPFPKFMQKLYLQCNVILKWCLWEVIQGDSRALPAWMGLVPCWRAREDKLPLAFCFLSVVILWGQDSSHCLRGKDWTAYQTPNQPASWSWISLFKMGRDSFLLVINDPSSGLLLGPQVIKRSRIQHCLPPLILTLAPGVGTWIQNQSFEIIQVKNSQKLTSKERFAHLEYLSSWILWYWSIMAILNAPKYHVTGNTNGWSMLR